jgi:hypothetical protein
MPNAAGVEEYRGSAMATYTNFRYFTYAQYDFYQLISNR